MSAVVELILAIWNVLGPVAAKMIEKAMAGEDPLSVLAKEHVDDIIPDPLKLELAEKAARARLAASGK